MEKLETISKITKDMTIASILESQPDKAMKLSETMTAVGLHCVGCGAATFETLEQGVLGHGMSQGVLDKLLVDLNKILEEKNDKSIDSSKCPLKLTDIAVKKVREIMANEKKENSGLRVAVLAGGCAGYSYDLSIQEKPKEGDFEFEQDGLKVFVDKDSLSMLEGVQVNYIDTLQESGFKFENPNAEGGCGCGKSFN